MSVKSTSAILFFHQNSLECPYHNLRLMSGGHINIGQFILNTNRHPGAIIIIFHSIDDKRLSPYIPFIFPSSQTRISTSCNPYVSPSGISSQQNFTYSPLSVSILPSTVVYLLSSGWNQILPGTSDGYPLPLKVELLL